MVVVVVLGSWFLVVVLGSWFLVLGLVVILVLFLPFNACSGSVPCM